MPAFSSRIIVHPGQRVLTVAHRYIGSVTRVHEDRSFEIATTEQGFVRLAIESVFTTTGDSVTLICGEEGLDRYRIPD